MNKTKITGHTRCPECFEKIGLTDWDDPDVVLINHRHNKHEVPLPKWATE